MTRGRGAPVQERRGRTFLSVRDQNAVAPLRKKRMMTVLQLFLIHRYKSSPVHWVTPTEDNENQTQKMKNMGIFSDVRRKLGK